MTFSYKKYFAFIAVIFVLKLLILGIYPFHHPSESRYASIAMRMELTGNYLMPYFDDSTPFFAKPPLSFWVSAISFKIFGFNEFAGRLPHFLALLAVCFLLYRFVEKIADKKTAVISVLVLSSCFLFYSLHSVMTEAFLLLGMTMITLSFWMQIESEKPKNIYGYLFFFGCVIAMLTKGPVGIVMPCFPIFIYLIISARWNELFKKFPIFLGTIIFIGLGLSWFVLAENKYPGFLQYFFVGENFDRFTKSGWEGDRYGNPHKVPFGAIWFFFIVSTLPVIFLLFSKPKEIIKTFFEKIKNGDQLFWFFFISLIAPLVVLTFMRNMIITYAMYSLVPFVVLVSIIIAEKNWYKFSSFLAYFTISIQCVAIIVMLINPIALAERVNYEAYLIKHIPKEALEEKDFTLYYIGTDDGIFSLKWYARDRVKLLLEENNYADFLNIPGSVKYVIGDEPKYLRLPQQYQKKLHKIICTKKRQTCLYEAVAQNL